MHVSMALGWMGAVVGLVLGAVFIVIRIRNKPKRQWMRRVSLIEWHDYGGFAAIEPPTKHWRGSKFRSVRRQWEYGVQVCQEREKGYEDRQRERIAQQRQIEAEYAEIMALDETQQREKLFGLKMRVDDNFSYGCPFKRQFSENLARLGRQYAAGLYVAALRGDRRAFLTLHALVTGAQNEFWQMTGSWYEYPAAWDSQLVRYIKEPYWGDFRNLGDLTREDLPIESMAAEALRLRDAVKVMRVLALVRPAGKQIAHRYAARHRRAIGGDVAVFQLLRLADQLRVDKADEFQHI